MRGRGARGKFAYSLVWKTCSRLGYEIMIKGDCVGLAVPKVEYLNTRYLVYAHALASRISLGTC